MMKKRNSENFVSLKKDQNNEEEKHDTGDEDKNIDSDVDDEDFILYANPTFQNLYRIEAYRQLRLNTGSIGYKLCMQKKNHIG